MAASATLLEDSSVGLGHKSTPKLYFNGNYNPADESETEPSTNTYSEESRKALASLKKAYQEKDLTLMDKIISEMVENSKVSGLKKLHTAAGYGFVELVEKYLKEDKEDANCTCSFNDITSITPMHFCAGVGPDPIGPHRAECIELLVKHNGDVNHQTSRLDSPLHWATKLADLKVCQTFIKHGANVNLINVDNCTCAHGAAFYKNLDVLTLLINNNVDVKVLDISGKNVLHLLCKDSFEDDELTFISETNLVEPKSVNKEIGEKRERQRKFVELVHRLLDEFGLDPNLKDSSDLSPMMYACEHANIELIRKLIEFKGDIFFMNDEGVNCLVLAIVNSAPSVVKFLISNGFDPKLAAPNVSYITDAAYLNEIEILNMLLDAGCDVNETKQDENGVILNPLWAACERANVTIVELLMSRGANTIVRHDLNMTALHCTAMAQYESLPIAKLLIENKCPLNYKSTQAGETPLFLACNSGYSEIVEYLLELGVDPNESSPISRTCFQQAVFRGHKEIILLLLNKGYKLTEDDRQDLKLFIMDLYQDNDVDMINFLLSKNLTDKPQILECIEKVCSWQQGSHLQSNEENSSASFETSSSIATTSDLKLNLTHSFPTTLDELDAYLNFKSNLNDSNSSDENDELK